MRQRKNITNLSATRELDLRTPPVPSKVKVYHSRKSDNWSTDQKFYDLVALDFLFDIDVCADETNAKCAKYYTKDQDGLLQDWGTSVCWCNPPYSNVAAWVEKAFEAAQRGATVVCLVAARTDTRWFNRYGMKAEIRFIRGRLRFGGLKESAPFASMLLVYRPPQFVLKSMASKEEHNFPNEGSENKKR